MSDIYREIVRVRESGKRAALATIISTRGSSPGRESMKLLICEDGTSVGTVGGGCVEADVYDAAMEVIETGETRLLKFSLTEKGLPGGGLVCGGTVQVYVEPILGPTLMVFGAGHVSLALSRVAATAGFRVVILDDREAFANRERFPDAAEVLVVPDFDEAVKSASLTRDTYVVIVTRGHQHDELVLRRALGSPVEYLGLIGSRTKIRRLFDNIASEGVEPASLDRVRAPIGLDIGAESPEEIAVAIVAEMIAVRRRGASILDNVGFMSSHRFGSAANAAARIGKGSPTGERDDRGGERGSV